ncbi:MAG: nitroreductase family protein [Clostridium sp.]|uniref:nitroreductase family protein n=1 Tax=Clostridium sp. TaxID=1506 RepID=UPI003F3D89D3
MEFYDVIKKRQSISKYKGEEVCKGSIANMIDAAMRAPSWKNKSSFKIIIIDDQNIKDDVASSILNKDDKAKDAVKEAPLLAVVVAEPGKSGEVDGKEFYLVDGAIAMEHFILAATAEGYGTMWIAALQEDKVKQTLNIPKDIKIIGITPVGIPAEIKEHNAEKDIKDYVFINKYSNPYIEK